MNSTDQYLERSKTADDQIRDHIRSIVREQPYVHHHYSGERFFKADRVAGRIETMYGQRVLLASEEIIPALAEGLEEEVGEESAGEIMYRCGYRWARREMHRFAPRFQREFEVNFNSAGMRFMLETWWWPLTTEGWGAWTVDLSQGRQGLIMVDIYESAVAKTLGNIGEVVCHFYAGQFAGVFTSLSRKELACIEIQCMAMGEDFCKFLVSSSQRVDAAAFWRNEGASGKDILKKIRDAK